jgi:hypothetical protein
MKISDIKTKPFILGFLDVLFLVLPGVLYIFLYRNDLFNSFDWTKLVLLSASVIAPFVFLNALMLPFFDKQLNNEKDFFFIDFSESIIFTGIIAYSFIAMDYYFLHNIKNTIGVFILLEMTIFLLTAIIDTYKKRKKKHEKS